MHVIEVIPLVRGSRVESLTYYSSTSYPVGSIITVPIRKKTARALVTSQQPVGRAKAALRTATFSLKKLPAQENVQSLPPLLIETAKQLTAQIPAQLGSILFSLLPEEIRNGEEELTSTLPCIGMYETPAISVLQATQTERVRTYRSHIREAFAHRGSVLLIVPTSADVARLEEVLAQGIEDRIISFVPGLSPKKRAKTYAAFHDVSNAKLIIATPQYCLLDRHDITHIIIEQSRSPYYQARTRPYLDYRVVLKTIAKIAGRHVLLGDLLPSSEDEVLRREDVYLTEGEHPKRIAFPGKFSIITQTDKPKPDSAFELLSPKLMKKIEATVKDRQSVFMYAARRGLAPVVACVDCGHIFRCPDSGTPYSLLKTMKGGREQRWFLSSVSGKRVPAADVCPDCGSWRLKERGVGIQHLHSELKAKLPDVNIVLFDHTTATTKKKAQSLAGQFYDQKGSVLLGTGMALPYLEKPVTLSTIPSLDAARTLPTWRAEEEFFALLLRLREITSDMLIVQTRSEIDEVLEYAKTGQVERFYDDEIELRTALSYPPFSFFIVLTYVGTPAANDSLRTLLLEQLGPWKPHAYKAPYTPKPGQQTEHMLLRIKRADWPPKTLMRLLTNLPPNVKIEVNPSKII